MKRKSIVSLKETRWLKTKLNYSTTITPTFSCSPVFDSESFPHRFADDIKIDTPHSKKTATSA